MLAQCTDIVLCSVQWYLPKSVPLVPVGYGPTAVSEHYTALHTAHNVHCTNAHCKNCTLNNAHCTLQTLHTTHKHTARTAHWIMQTEHWIMHVEHITLHNAHHTLLQCSVSSLLAHTSSVEACLTTSLPLCPPIKRAVGTTCTIQPLRKH